MANSTSSESTEQSRHSEARPRYSHGMNRQSSEVSHTDDSQASNEHSLASESWCESESMETGATEDSERPPVAEEVQVDINSTPDDESLIGMESPVDNYKDSKAKEKMMLEEKTMAKTKVEEKVPHKNSFGMPWRKRDQVAPHAPQPPSAVDTLKKTKRNPKKWGGVGRGCTKFYALVFFVGLIVVVLVKTNFISSLQAPPPGLPDAAESAVHAQLDEQEGEEMLLLAERIVTACSEWEMGIDEGECQQLCEMHMCCFDEDEETSCVSDENVGCPVHAGCEVLIGIDEDSEEFS